MYIYNLLYSKNKVNRGYSHSKIHSITWILQTPSPPNQLLFLWCLKFPFEIKLLSIVTCHYFSQLFDWLYTCATLTRIKRENFCCNKVIWHDFASFATLHVSHLHIFFLCLVWTYNKKEEVILRHSSAAWQEDMMTYRQ